MIFNILMGVSIMRRLLISLVVLVILPVMVIPIYGGGKLGSNLKVIDANGQTLGGGLLALMRL